MSNYAFKTLEELMNFSVLEAIDHLSKQVIANGASNDNIGFISQKDEKKPESDAEKAKRLEGEKEKLEKDYPDLKAAREKIKKEYDDYVKAIVKSQKTRNEVLGRDYVSGKDEKAFKEAFDKLSDDRKKEVLGVLKEQKDKLTVLSNAMKAEFGARGWKDKIEGKLFEPYIQMTLYIDAYKQMDAEKKEKEKPKDKNEVRFPYTDVESAVSSNLSPARLRKLVMGV